MATILRPPLTSAQQVKRAIAPAFVAANLLLTTLAVAPGTPPPGEQLSDSAPRVKRSLDVQAYPNLLGTTLAAQEYAPGFVHELGDRILKFEVRADQYTNALVLQPVPKVGRLDATAPPPKRAVYVQPTPNLLQNTLAPPTAVLGLPLNAVRWDASAPPRKPPVWAVQQHNLLTLGINPNAKVQGLTDSAPSVKGAVYVQPPLNLLETTLAPAPAVLGLPLNTARQDWSAPPPKIQVWATQQHNTLALGINPNPNPQGLTDSAPPPKDPVQVDVYPNLMVTTLYIPPVFTGAFGQGRLIRAKVQSRTAKRNPGSHDV